MYRIISVVYDCFIVSFFLDSICTAHSIARIPEESIVKIILYIWYKTESNTETELHDDTVITRGKYLHKLSIV